jgi:hypothetical protein
MVRVFEMKFADELMERVLQNLIVVWFGSRADGLRRKNSTDTEF